VGEKKLYQVVAEWLNRQAEHYRVGEWSRVGAVVGATYPEQVAELRAVLPHSILLLPGLGLQGGEPLRGPGLLNSASRSLYYPGGKPDVQAALIQAEEYLKALR
jgi:orotidine-5'-phosphate decarboxylase